MGLLGDLLDGALCLAYDVVDIGGNAAIDALGVAIDTGIDIAAEVGAIAIAAKVSDVAGEVAGDIIKEKL